ncbi:MAG: potassium channel family protein [Candidatus Binatus sp.]|jgi:voltage-gated potassium channel
MAGGDQMSVEATLIGQLRDEIHRRLAPHRHTALLAAIIAAFMVRPLIGDSGAGPIMFSSAMLVLLLLALYNIDVDELVGDRETLIAQRRRRSIIAWTLGIPAIVERFVVVFSPSHSIYLAGSILWMLLFAFITWNELRAVLRQKEITREVISMSISTYLLLGLTCGLFYILLHDLQPNAFSFGSGAPLSEQQTIPVMIYFSLTTLSTIGFGDITPVTLQARYAAVAEGITGQFYLAILVARLVGMQMTQSPTQHAEQKAFEAGTEPK